MSVKREVLVLVGMVLAVDAIFVGLYFFAGIGNAGDTTKVVFTVVWTVITLAVVLHGLKRIRSFRGAR
ncbi:MAG TPA: hypothetical protein VJ808_02270 [Gemmatimonadales bacterium]|nr:hypothetical protein [Gemmatimonadales bacterium]